MLASAAVVALVGATSTVLGRRSYFFADDFIWMRIARDSDLNWSYLVRSVFGHFVPGFHGTNWLLARTEPLSWTAGSAYLVLALVAATLLLERIARELGVGRSGSIGVAAAFGLSPIAVPSLIWWSAGAPVLTTTAASLACVLGFLRWERDRRARWLALMTLALFGAVLFWEKSLLVPVWLALFSVLVLDSGQSRPARWTRAVRRWPAWLGLVVAAFPGAAYYATHDYMDEAGPAPEALTAARFVWRGLASLPANATGVGPLVPDGVAELAGAAILVAVGGWVVRHRDARGVAGFAALCVVLNLAVLARGRALLFPGSASDPRYQLDSLVVVALSAAAAVGHRRQQLASSGISPVDRRTYAPVLGVAVLFAVFTWPARVHLVDAQMGVRASAYVSNFHRTWPEAQAANGSLPFLDLRVPDWLVARAFDPYGDYANLLPLLDTRVEVRRLATGFALDRSGRVGRARVEPSGGLARLAGCPSLDSPVRIGPSGFPDRHAPLLLVLHVEGASTTIRITWLHGDELRGVTEAEVSVDMGRHTELATAGPARGWDTVELVDVGSASTCLVDADRGRVVFGD